MAKARSQQPAGPWRGIVIHISFGAPMRVAVFLLLWTLASAAIALAQSSAGASSEQKAARYFNSIKSQPLELHAFLKEMPKGADLHSHLSGAVYAETYIKWAAAATNPKICVDSQTLTLSTESDDKPCDEAKGRPPASRALWDGVLYRRMVDAWSMRSWEYSGQSGHDHFFDAFGKFGAVSGNFAAMLAEAASRAASDRLSYLELMLTPDDNKSRDLGRQLQWSNDLAKMRQQLLDRGIAEAVKTGRSNLDKAEAGKREALKCDTPQADPGCRVEIRYVFQIGRTNPPEQAFAQMVAAFEMASLDPRLVALNLVQAEDNYAALENFSGQMEMLDYLHKVYPKVRITLHAGEFAPGLVPPEQLRFHIRDSIRRGHAERIGHGVAVMYESDPYELLREMAQKNVMVEICLSSNDGILGIRGKQHPLALYIKHGVPVALATDDQAISRSDMTGEYKKAVEDHALDYLQLKRMARTSLEHAFVGGASLWRDAKRFAAVEQCAKDRVGAANPSAACRRFLDASRRAQLQWDLEAAFAQFENRY